MTNQRMHAEPLNIFWVVVRQLLGQVILAVPRLKRFFDQMVFRWHQRDDPPGVREICERTSLSRSVARRVLERFNEHKHSEIVGLLIAQAEDTLFHDPIEDLPELADVIVAAEAEIEAACEGTARGLGSCNTHWQVRKQILRDNYGIDWLSPRDMNPSVRFD